MNSSGALVSFEDVQAYLNAFTNYERVTDYKSGPACMGTERIEELLSRLGKPHLAAPVIHVAGSKGKGSTCCLASRLLQSLGFRVGLFVSPHIGSLCERVQINGEPVSRDVFCEAFARVQPVVEDMRNHPELKPPTYFEIITAIAFVAFAAAGVEVTVMEVGLGGRLDATNLSDLPVTVSGITPVSRDHVKQLGSDLVSIAGEKAGILRRGVPMVMAEQEAEVADFLRDRAAELGCAVIAAGRGITVRVCHEPPPDTPEAPQRLDLCTWRAIHRDVPLPLLGRHQAGNAVVGLGLVEAFLESVNAGPVDTASLRRAWREVTMPGRIEVVARKPWVILDGAHNGASAWALGETLQQRFSASERVMIFAVARDKEVNTILRILAPLAQRMILTTIPTPRCMDTGELVEMVSGAYDANVLVEPDPVLAIEMGRGLAGAAGLVFAAGSLYLVGALRKCFVD